MLEWLAENEGLSGWAQFGGAMLALLVTYLTAFGPIWKRKKQLRNAAARLLANGYEAIESYHRTSEFGDLFPITVRQAALSMGLVADEMSRFPIFELEDQGSHSLARKLVAMNNILGSMKLTLETIARDLEERPETEDDRENLRHMLGIALTNAEALMTGKVLERPQPPGAGIE